MVVFCTLYHVSSEIYGSVHYVPHVGASGDSLCAIRHVEHVNLGERHGPLSRWPSLCGSVATANTAFLVCLFLSFSSTNTHTHTKV